MVNFTSIFGRRFGITRRENIAMSGKELLTPLAKDTLITSAQLLALNATPQTLVAAPGSNRILIPVAVFMTMPYNSTAYDGIASGEDLAVRYTGSSGAVALTVETTGFLDQTSNQQRWTFAGAAPAATAGGVAVVTNAALVLHMTTGEIATGNSPLYVRTYYYDVPATMPTPLI